MIVYSLLIGQPHLGRCSDVPRCREELRGHHGRSILPRGGRGCCRAWLYAYCQHVLQARRAAIAVGRILLTLRTEADRSSQSAWFFWKLCRVPHRRRVGLWNWQYQGLYHYQLAAALPLPRRHYCCCCAGDAGASPGQHPENSLLEQARTQGRRVQNPQEQSWCRRNWGVHGTRHGLPFAIHRPGCLCCLNSAPLYATPPSPV